MKWVGLFQVGIFWVVIFRGRNFPGGSLMGGNFPGGDFPGENFPRTLLYIIFFSNWTSGFMKSLLIQAFFSECKDANEYKNL